MPRWLPRAAVMLLLCAVAITQLQRVRGRGLVASLAREVGSVQAISPRLSVAYGYRPCTPRPAAEPGMPDMGCAPAPAWKPSRRVNEIAARAGRGVRERSDPDAMHAAALIDLLSEPGMGKALERSIQALWTVGRTSTRPAAAWADLSAAYLVRAERGGSPRDLLSAVEAAERALEHDSRNPSALFNRALALQRFGLADAAAWAWGEYLAADAASPWASEARRRLAAATGGPVRPARVPAPGAPPAAYAAYAREDPQAARLLAQDDLLAGWGAARLNGEDAKAERFLERAKAIGDALQERRGGDQTVADAVHAIRSAGSGDALRRLAQAHRDYGAGRALYESGQYVAAASPLGAAAVEGSPAARAWARLHLANVHVYAGDPVRGEPVLLALATGTDTLRYPALAARAALALAGTRMQGDRYERALEPGEDAARWFARAGEQENESTALSVLANAYFRMGDADAGYGTWHRTLLALRSYRDSKRLHNLVIAIATAAAEDGLPRAAARVQDEGVAVTRRRGDPILEAEAWLARARLLPEAGRPGFARRDIDSARIALGRAPAELTVWLGADLQVAEAVASELARPANPARAAAALDSAAALFAARVAPIRGFPVVVRAAEARLAMGDLPGATTRLESAFAMLERRRDSILVEPRRAAVFDAARGVVDRVVSLHLAAGDPARALRFLDDGRASLAPSGARGQRSRGGPIVGPAGEVGVELALVGDTLLAWTVTGRRVSVARTAVDTVRLVRTLRRLQALVQAERDDRAIGAALEQLYDWLVRPLEGRLGPAGTVLVVVADGDLAQVPFAALRDRRRGRFLVQDHPLRFAVSLREAWRARPAAESGEVVLVADPAFAAREHPGLQRLPGAAGEAAALFREYGSGRMLDGPRATRDAVRHALAAAGVVHYAGHAVFDDERPERSYLVLAPLPGRPGTGRLTAAELAELKVGHAPLVVLAACRTVNAGRGRASGFSGLAGGLLAAGVGGVVGGLWEVDDALTRPLMIEFHRAYRAYGDGARALREAQLRMLGSADPALRSPATWAGFRYAGR